MGISVPFLVGTYVPHNWRKTVASLFTKDNIVRITLAVILPLAAFVAWRYAVHENLGDIAGGSDHGMFVPFSNDGVGLGHRNRPFYSFFSWLHLVDILSAYLLACPLSLGLISLACWMKKKMHAVFSEPDSRFLLILGLCAASCLVIPVLWHFDFTAYGDWNITSTYLFPLNAFAWIYFIYALRNQEISVMHEVMMSCLIAAQLLMAGSLYIQLI